MTRGQLLSAVGLVVGAHRFADNRFWYVVIFNVSQRVRMRLRRQSFVFVSHDVVFAT